MKESMDRRIDAVEQADVARAEGRQSQVGQHRFTQAVVFGVDGVVIGRDGADRRHHLRTGADGVFVEIEPQQTAPPFQRSAV